MIYKLEGANIKFNFTVFFHPKSKIIVKNKNSKIVFKDNCNIAKGCRIIVDENAEASLGKSVTILENCYIEIGKNAKLNINEDSFLNENCRIVCLEEIDIGQNVAIGPEVAFFDNDHIMKKSGKQDWNIFKSSKIIIGDNVWIGAKSIILRGSIIEDNSAVAAMSVIKFKVCKNNIFYTNIEKRFKEII